MGLQYVFCCGNELENNKSVIKTQPVLISPLNQEMESQEEENSFFSKRKKAPRKALFKVLEKKRFRQWFKMDSRIGFITILIQRNQTYRGSATFGKIELDEIFVGYYLCFDFVTDWIIFPIGGSTVLVNDGFVFFFGC